MNEIIIINDDLSEYIDEIQNYVKELTPISDMALLLNVDERRLRDAIDDLSSPVSLAYRQAKAQVALGLRRRDIELAEAGSSTAADEVNAHFRRMIRDE